jgi:hypothetical protein
MAIQGDPTQDVALAEAVASRPRVEILSERVPPAKAFAPVGALVNARQTLVDFGDAL